MSKKLQIALVAFAIVIGFLIIAVGSSLLARAIRQASIAREQTERVVATPTVEPTAVPTPTPEPEPTVELRPTAPPIPRLHPLRDDEPDANAVKAAQEAYPELVCAEDYCTTKDDRLLFVFFNTRRDAVVIGRSQDVAGAYEMVSVALTTRGKSHEPPGGTAQDGESEGVKGFIEREVVQNSCNYQTPGKEKAQEFEGYRVVVVLLPIRNHPNSGHACFVLLEYE